MRASRAANCFFLLPSKWFWKMRIKQHLRAKFYLVNGQGLTASSNNPGVIPNSDEVFTGKTGQEGKRVVEIYGLTPGTALVEFRGPGSSKPVVTMQIEVVALPGTKPSFVSFSGKSAAINVRDVAHPYRLDSTQTATGGPPENLFDSVPGGTKHVVLNCHGQMNAKGGPEGITLFIAGNVTRGNCTAVFAKLKGKSAGGVIWIGGCEAGADNEFCKLAVLASGCYVVAPAITLQSVPVPAGKIDFFAGSMIKYFNKDGGARQ
jgi:hypothetical protein